MIKNKEISSGIQQYEKILASTDKLEDVRERTLEQGRFKMAAVLDAEVMYDMAVNQLEDGIMRFQKPDKAKGIKRNDNPELNSLLNLVSIGLNTNRYLNNRLYALKNAGKSLDKAIMDEYGHEID